MANPAAAVRRPLAFVVALAALGALTVGLAGAQTPPRAVVEIVQVVGTVDPPVLAGLRDVVDRANADGSLLVIVQLDTPGGIAVRLDEIVSIVRASSVPVAVWVGPFGAEARGAGAVLLAAAHVSAMARDTAVGPVVPVDIAHGDDEPATSDGLAALLVGLIPGGAVELAAGPVSPERARALGLVDLVVDGLEPLLVEMDGRSVTTVAGTSELRLRTDEVTVRFHSLGLLRRVLHASLDPTLVYLLVIAVLMLVGFEVFQPGFGVAGVTALLLAPLALYGLVVLPVAWWALALVVLGVVLLAADLALARLGPLSAGGAIALAAGSWWLFQPVTGGLRVPPWLVGVAVVANLAFFVVVMTVVLRAQAAPDLGDAAVALVGRVGVVRSTLNPEGHVFVSGALWRARWAGVGEGGVATGAAVVVRGADGAVLLVGEPEEEHAPDR